MFTSPLCSGRRTDHSPSRPTVATGGEARRAGHGEIQWTGRTPKVELRPPVGPLSGWAAPLVRPWRPAAPAWARSQPPRVPVRRRAARVRRLQAHVEAGGRRLQSAGASFAAHDLPGAAGLWGVRPLAALAARAGPERGSGSRRHRRQPLSPRRGRAQVPGGPGMSAGAGRDDTGVSTYPPAEGER
jgi:hypothetical protein